MFNLSPHMTEIFMGLTCFVAIVAMIWVVITDITEMKIRDLASYILIAAWLIRGVIAPESVNWIFDPVWAFGIFAIFFIGALTGGVGGGDVKFMGSTTLWVGSVFALDFILATFIAGGLLAIFSLILGFVLSRLPISYPSAINNLAIIEKKSIPYGVAISIVAIYFTLNSHMKDLNLLSGVMS